MDADFTSAPVERRADLVVLLADGVPVLVIVVEVQLRIAAAKLRAWPLYLVLASARHECPAVVLVVTPDEQVASWARQPIQLNDGSVVHVDVLGPDAVPVVTDPAQAAGNPELAVLSAIACGRELSRGPAVAVAALGAIERSSEEQARLYFDLIHATLSDAVRKAVEELMASGNYEYQSDFAKKYYGQGKAEGKAEGEAKGKAEAILAFLDARGIPLTPDQRARTLATLDLTVLNSGSCAPRPAPPPQKSSPTDVSAAARERQETGGATHRS